MRKASWMAVVAASAAMFSGQTGKAAEMIRYTYQPGELTRLCDLSMQNTQKKLDAIAALSKKQRNIDSTLLTFERVMSEFSDETSPLTFMGYVSTDKAISAEGSECERKISEFFVGVITRKDLYEAIKGHAPRNGKEKQLLKETLKGFERNGLNLPDDKLAEVKKLKQELAAKEAEFTKNLNNDNSTVEFMADELRGVPSSLLERLKKTADGARYIVTTKPTDYVQVMENCESADTRRRMLFAYNNRAAEANTRLLTEAIALRQKISKLLKFRTWADYQTEDRMAKDSKTVLKFLNGLRTKLAERNKADLAKLLKFKREKEPGAKELNPWDLTFLSYQLKKRDYELDDEKIREYFPSDTVIAGMFEVYSKLLGVKYVEVKDAQVWAPGVKLYEIRDSENNDLLAHFFADFFPRPGKYGHAAAFNLISGRTLPDGKYLKPVSAIVANMNPPSGGKPSMLNHDEVETTFHEFGHIMHQTLTRAPFASLSGSSVARDFVEAPSQMLENWVWSKELLPTISGHYQDASKKLPEAILKKLLEAKDFNQGAFYTRQLYLALMDMTYHTSDDSKLDPTVVADQLYREIVGIEPIQGGHFPAGFGHLMGGYDAGYYGYLWSEVYAEDMFTKFEKEGLLNSKVGRKYRETVLEQGKMVEAIQLLRKFLGREPNNKAFFKKLHIGE